MSHSLTFPQNQERILGEGTNSLLVSILGMFIAIHGPIVI
jgi:hypothetical protein